MLYRAANANSIYATENNMVSIRTETKLNGLEYRLLARLFIHMNVEHKSHLQSLGHSETGIGTRERLVCKPPTGSGKSLCYSLLQ